jgi:hypothetical protein
MDLALSGFIPFSWMSAIDRYGMWIMFPSASNVTSISSTNQNALLLLPSDGDTEPVESGYDERGKAFLIQEFTQVFFYSLPLTYFVPSL